jgi:DNA repair exonuclease SbcCD ATPase subunit
MPLKKPSQLFQEEKVFITEDHNPVVETFNETFDKFRGNLTVVENLTEKVNYLTEEIENKITKGDLENAMLSHLMMVDESIKSIDTKVKGLNKNDLLEFKRTSSHLLELVEDLSKNQFPKYKRKIVDTEVKISEKLNDFKEEVTNTQEIAENNLQEKLDNFAEVVDNNFSIFNENIQETKSYVNETVNTYKKLSKILESKVEKENERLDEYSSVLENFNNDFLKFQENIQEQIKEYEKINSVLDERFESFGNELNEWKDINKTELENFKSQTNNTIVEFKNDIGSLKANIAVFEKHNKSLVGKVDNFQESLNSVQENFSGLKTLKESQVELKEQLSETKKDLNVVEKYIQNHHNDIEELKEEVFTEIEGLPFGNIQENIQRLESKIDFIRETYSKIEPEVIVKEVIKEGLTEPPSTNNQDPLTPLDQNFVTLDQLQQHYRLFLNRIQQQLSTLGGGGETQLKYLDDIVGIATNASAYDGKYLKYNHSLGKFEFDSVDITNDSWADGINGPYTNGSVGIGTSVANCELDVVGNVCVTGVVTATDFNSLSDLKLKENVEVIENPVDTIMKIEGVNFNWKESGKLSMGVIAQQLEETLPQLVSGDEIKTVNYNGLVGLLIEVVKDQQKQIDELKDLLDK